MPEPQTHHDPVGYTTDYMAKTRQVSSRLAKREQNKLAKQTAILIGTAFFVIIAFIFAVIPGLIRLSSMFTDNGTNTDLGDTIPPRPPTVSSPVSATKDAQIEVSGFSEANSEVVLVLNGQEKDHVVAGEDGTFKMTITLAETENELRFFAIDGAKNESDVSHSYKVKYDAEPPTIVLETPTNGQSFELHRNQNIEVKGTTEPNAKVYLNDRLVFARSDGSFSTSFQLSEGQNLLKIKAVDEAGNETETEITVSFRL